VSGLALADGRLLWRFDPAVLDLASGEGPLSGFRLCGGRLFFMQGERALWALDGETGQVLWAHWAPGARLQLPAAGRLSPWFRADCDRVALQTSGGRCRILDSATGQMVHEYDAGAGPWPRPPLALTEGRLVVVPDGRHVALLDLAAGKEMWRYPLGRDASRTGEAAHVLGSGDRLLVLVPRNFGTELLRLDAATGVPRWPKPLLLDDEDLDLTHSAVGPDSVYLVAGNLLRAVSLADGKPLWDAPLTGGAGPWRVQATGRWLLAHPAEARTELDTVHALRRYQVLDGTALYPTQAALPLSGALPLVLRTHWQATAPAQFPVLLCDPRDGQLVQRLNFTTRGPQADLVAGPRGMFVGLADAVWCLR
jgi:outer membrane protein assembly factor BamB